MSVRVYSPRTWTDDDAQTLTMLAAQIAPALEAARLYESTRAARVQAEAATRVRDEVLAGVTHDLTGPLARIRLYAELIQADAARLEPTDAAQQLSDWSERIIAATSSMQSIMQELVEAARLELGHALQLDRRRLDLVGLTRRLMHDQIPPDRRSSLSTTIKRLEGWWDEARLARAIGNLFENAVKYSESGTVIEVGIERASGEAATELAILRVRDHGRGIPAEDLPHVFERFYRGSNVPDEVRGSGLGLASAQQMVEQHGGRIEIDSQPGEGTRVSLYLPRGRHA
jgi:signal transduction histidine kinase